MENRLTSMFLTKQVNLCLWIKITQQDTLIWCKFINKDLSAFHKEMAIVHCMIVCTRVSNDWTCLIARKIILKIYTTGHFHDAKIIIIIIIILFLQVYDTRQQPIIEIYEQHPYRDWSFLVFIRHQEMILLLTRKLEKKHFAV